MAETADNPMLREVAKITVLTHCTEFEESLHALDTIADAVRCAQGELDDIGLARLISTVNAQMWAQSRELRSLAERL